LLGDIRKAQTLHSSVIIYDPWSPSSSYFFCSSREKWRSVDQKHFSRLPFLRRITVHWNWKSLLLSPYSGRLIITDGAATDTGIFYLTVQLDKLDG